MKTIIISLLLICCVGCKKPAPHSELSFPIKMAETTVTSVPVVLNSFGTLSSPNTVNLQAQVSGEIIQTPFKDGDFVKEGDLLVSIDPSPFLADLQRAKSRHFGALAQADYAKQSYESYKQLRDQDFISVLDLANYLKTLQVADADVIASLADVENAKINLGYTQITSPIKGVIGFMNYREGNIAHIQDNLVSIVQVQPLYVTFSLSEQDLWTLREALSQGPLTVDGTFLSKEQPPIKGTIYAIDNSVNTKTGTILIKAEFPNEDLSAWPGEFVKLSIGLKTLPSAVVIDKNALQYGQQGPFVFVVDTNMTVSVRPVTPGPNWGDKVAILNGLKPQENVVIDGQLNLYPGAKVYVPS